MRQCTSGTYHTGPPQPPPPSVPTRSAAPPGKTTIPTAHRSGTGSAQSTPTRPSAHSSSRATEPYPRKPATRALPRPPSSPRPTPPTPSAPQRDSPRPRHTAKSTPVLDRQTEPNKPPDRGKPWLRKPHCARNLAAPGDPHALPPGGPSNIPFPPPVRALPNPEMPPYPDVARQPRHRPSQIQPNQQVPQASVQPPKSPLQ